MPFTEVNNGDVRIVELGRFERLIVLAALDNYNDTLKKIAKKESDLGVVNLEVFRRRACISGDDGWGKSLRGKFAEFGSDDDESMGEQLDLEEAIAERAKSLVTISGALVLVAVDLPEGRLELLTEEERVDVLAWAEAAYRAADNPVGAVEVPDRPRVLAELALTEEEAEQWIAAGPWRPTWDAFEKTESTEAHTIYYGDRDLPDESDEFEDTEQAWPSEPRARLGCALLNKERAEAAAAAEIPAPAEEGPTETPDVLARECATCNAKPGEPCRSSAGHPIATDVHAPRLKAVGAYGNDLTDAVIASYADRVLTEIFGYVTPVLRERARKDRSIDVTKKWVREALEQRPTAEV